MRLLREMQRGKVAGGHQGQQIMAAGDMSAASIESDSISIEHTPIVSIECAWSNGSTPTGSLQLYGSVSGNNWFAVGSSVAVSGDSGCAQLLDANAGYLFAMAVYTKSGGSGDLDMFAEAKGV